MTGTCRCCEPAAGLLQTAIYNRPSLRAIGYRIGRYSTFRRALLEAIPAAIVEAEGAGLRPLLKWKSRTSGDYGIAVLEMWAYLADILTFYQERIANEAFLGTAVHLESVLRLANLLGYTPAPGMAATALLAFTLDRGKRLAIPAGLRSQSVPEAEQKPQKFETIETITADAALNKVRVFGQPVPNGALDAGSTGGVLSAAMAAQPPLPPGADLVLFGTGSQTLEEKRAVSVAESGGETTLTWSPAVQTAKTGPRMFRWTRKYRLYGSLVPESFLRGEPAGSNTYELNWSEVQPDFTLASGISSLNLDGAYDDLKPGQRLLVSAPGLASVVTVTGLAQVTDTLGPAPVPVTQLSFTPALAFAGSIDRRLFVLYALAEPEILFAANRYPPAVSGNQIYIQAAAIGDYTASRRLILDDASARPEPVTITSSAMDAGGQHVMITFTPALSRSLEGGSAFLYGNVAVGTHGETVKREVLGNGDAAQSFQLFKLAKSPVTFVPAAGAPNGAANTLKSAVDGIQWKEVQSLYGARPADRVFVTARDEKGVMTVRFGDGITGSRLISGRANVVASYRQGTGLAGNVGAGAIRNLLDRPTGLRNVVNPLPAAGGAEPETIETARTNAPNTVRTFGRIVSVRDFEDYARETATVAKALAVVDWDGEEQAVFLTVAGNGGAEIAGAVLANLIADLNARRDPHRKLHLVPHRNVALQVQAAIQVDPVFEEATVQKAVKDALLAWFSFDNMKLGGAVHLSEVFAAIQAVEGVLGADVNRLQFKNGADQFSHGATADDVQPRLRIYSHEIAFIEDAAGDIDITLGLP